MPESKRRKRKYTGPTGRQVIAALDGTVITVKACCRVDVTIGHPRCQAAHDTWCSVPHDTSDAGQQRRLQVMLMVSDKLGKRGVRTTVVVNGGTGDSVLMILGRAS